jgi:hypothetical protein
MRRASAGVIETGSWSTRVTVELLRLGRRWPPLRAQLAHVAPGGGGLACPTRLAGGRPRARPREVTTDHLFFRLTLAKLRYSSTRRRRAPGSTYGFNRLLPSRVSNKRATDSRDVARAYLSSAFHVTVQSATTWRKAARVSGGAYVFPSRLPSRCLSSQACPWSRGSLKLYLVPVTEVANVGFGSPGLMKRIARLMWPLRWRTTRATSPADCSLANRCSDTQAYKLPSA